MVGLLPVRPAQKMPKIYLESFVDQAHLEQLEQDAKAFVAAAFANS